MSENFFIGLAQEKTAARTFFLFVYQSQEEKNKEGKIRHHSYKVIVE
jgi:hypothetical protein